MNDLLKAQARRPNGLWLVILLLIVTWIGARGLNADALWFDEYWSVYNAGGAQYGPLSPAGIWERVSAQDPWQAPSYFMLLAGWGALVGWTEFAIRAISLLAGVLSVAWMYRLGRDMVSPLGGLAATVTVGASAYYLYFFHELRTYTLVILLIPPVAWSYWRIIAGRGGRWTQVTLVVSAALLLYTHYFAALTLLTLGLYHLLFVHKDARWWRATLPLALAGAVFLPWVGVLLSGLNSAVEDTLRQSETWTPRQAVQGVLFMFSNASVVLAILLGLYSLVRKRAALFAWFWLLVVLGALLLINARFGVILEVRYLLPLWPALGVIAALALDRLAKTSLSLTAAVLFLWLLAGIWNSIDPASAWTLHNPHFHIPWNTLVKELRPRLEPDDALVFLLYDLTWSSYHQKPFEYYLYGLPVRGTLLEKPANLGADEYQRRAQAASAGATRLWLAYSDWLPTTHVTDFQRDHDPNFLYCGTFSQEPHITLDLYSSGIKDFAPLIFGDSGGIHLTSLDTHYMPDAHSLNVTALWSLAPDVPPNTYSVALHIDDADSQLVAQTDYGLPDDPRSCHSADIPLAGLPPGDYRLYTIVYAWETGQRLTGTASAGATGDKLLVGQFKIQ